MKTSLNLQDRSKASQLQCFQTGSDKLSRFGIETSFSQSLVEVPASVLLRVCAPDEKQPPVVVFWSACILIRLFGSSFTRDCAVRLLSKPNIQLLIGRTQPLRK